MAEKNIRTCDFDQCEKAVIGHVSMHIDGTLPNVKIDACAEHLYALAERYADFGIDRQLFFRAFEAMTKRLRELARG